MPLSDVIEMDEYLAKTSPNRDVVALYALCWAPNCSPRFQIVDCDNAKYPMDHFEYWATGKSSLLNGERQLYGYFLAKKKICFEGRYLFLFFDANINHIVKHIK